MGQGTDAKGRTAFSGFAVFAVIIVIVLIAVAFTMSRKKIKSTGQEQTVALDFLETDLEQEPETDITLDDLTNSKP